MLVEYAKDYLRELFEGKEAHSKKYRFQQEIVNGYRKVVSAIKTARHPKDLISNKGLKFEALKESKGEIYSVRANSKYRVLFTIRQEGETKVVTICRILELSNHYK